MATVVESSASIEIKANTQEEWRVASMLSMQKQLDILNGVDTITDSNGSIRKASREAEISDEVSELRRNLKWNWWAGTEDSAKIDQLKIKIKFSLMNLWHLSLSQAYESEVDMKDLISKLFTEIKVGWKDNLETSLDPFTLYTLVKITIHLGFTLPELYRWFTGTYALYNYRAKQPDTYKTKWADGREDIEHLAEVMKEVSGVSDEGDLAIVIYEKLNERYNPK